MKTHLNLTPNGDIHDELHIGVIVVVGAPGDGHVVVGHLDVLGVGLEILRRYHDDESHGPLVLEHLVRPATHRPHTFDGCDAVVGYQHLKIIIKAFKKSKKVPVF